MWTRIVLIFKFLKKKIFCNDFILCVQQMLTLINSFYSRCTNTLFLCCKKLNIDFSLKEFTNFYLKLKIKL